jgi:hypothetical protein
MIDIHDDKKQAEEWVENTEGEMSQEQLVYLAINGHKECEHYCGSREYCELGACYCIRANFPTPKLYELYQQLRKTYVEMESLAVISGLSKNLQIVHIDKADINLGEKNEKEERQTNQYKPN